MAWKFVGNCEPLPGIGYGPLTDAEFEEKAAAYEAQFPGQEGAVKRSKLYEHVKDKPEAKAGGGDE